MLKGHWLFGNLLEFKKAPHEFLARASSMDHGLVQFRLFNKKMIAVLDAECAEEIFKLKSSNFPRGKQRKALEALLGQGLLNQEGEKWKNHRRMVAQGFKPDFLQYSLNHNSALVANLLSDWEQCEKDNKAVNIVDEMRRITLSVIIKALFSVDLNFQENKQLYSAIINANKLLFKKYVSLLSAPAGIPTQLNKQMALTKDTMVGFAKKQIKAKLADPGRKKGDIVDHFLDLYLEGEMSLEEIYDEIRTLIVAGFETSAAALSWTLYSIAKNPQTTERWYQELDEILGEQPPTWENIGKLKYTEQLFMEGLRLYPPGYMVSRTTLEDEVIQGYFVPAGSPILLSIYGIHRSPKYWENPNEFNPERFNSDWPEKAFFPFGIGKHICIGNRFSMLESILILACIGQRFRITLSSDNNVTAIPKVTLSPSEEIHVHLQKR